jgi:hypothetical protein
MQACLLVCSGSGSGLPDPDTISLMSPVEDWESALSESVRESVSAHASSNFRDIEFVFGWTCYLVNPPKLP